MSADDRTNGGKTLLPELLPVPGAGEKLTPRERVAERARLLLQRFRGLGTTAGAAVLSLQCGGYAVVDPLPPPPLQCTSEPVPFASILPRVTYGTGGAGLPPVLLELYTTPYPPSNFVGYAVDAVRVTNGTLVRIEDMSRPVATGGTLFQITIVPSGSPAQIGVDVDLACGDAATIKHYRIEYPLNASALPIVVEVEPADGGTD